MHDAAPARMLRGCLWETPQVSGVWGGAPPGTRTPNPLIKRQRNYLLYRAPQCHEIQSAAGKSSFAMASVSGRADLCCLVLEPMDAPWTHSVVANAWSWSSVRILPIRMAHNRTSRSETGLIPFLSCLQCVPDRAQTRDQVGRLRSDGRLGLLRRLDVAANAGSFLAGGIGSRSLPMVVAMGTTMGNRSDPARTHTMVQTVVTALSPGSAATSSNARAAVVRPCKTSGNAENPRAPALRLRGNGELRAHSAFGSPNPTTSTTAGQRPGHPTVRRGSCRADRSRRPAVGVQGSDRGQEPDQNTHSTWSVWLRKCRSPPARARRR